MDKHPLQAFAYGDSMVRTVKDEESGEFLFVAKDVLDILELENTTRALDGLDDDELTLLKVMSGGQMRDMKCVTESGLYNLIFKSRKEEAKTFKRWVTHEVLPSIRKTGGYGEDKADGVVSVLVSVMDKMTCAIESLAERVRKVEGESKETTTTVQTVKITSTFKPREGVRENPKQKAEFVDAVMRLLSERPEGVIQAHILREVYMNVGEATRVRWLREYLGTAWDIEVVPPCTYVYRLVS